MSIVKNWMVEDNITDFEAAASERELYNFIDECLLSIFMSSSYPGRHFRSKPGQAVEWVLERMPKEKANRIRKNLKAKHLSALCGGLGKAHLEGLHDTELQRAKDDFDKIAPKIKNQHFSTKFSN